MATAFKNLKSVTHMILAEMVVMRIGIALKEHAPLLSSSVGMAYVYEKILSVTGRVIASMEETRLAADATIWIRKRVKVH